MGKEDPEVPEQVIQPTRREIAMVRDLDEWKVFQERKEPMRPGENRELLMRVFRLSKATGADILMSKYAEFQLRQRITSTNSVRDLYTFERDKNDMVLEVLHSELERIRLETVRHFNQMHSKKTRLLAIEALVEDKENRIELLKKDILDGKAKLDKRKKKLQKDGKVAALKHLAVLREASKGTYNDIEMVESSPRNVSSSSVLAPFPPGMDYFEMDGAYSKEKTRVEVIISHARRLNREVRDLNNESLDLQRGVSESEAIIRGLKESARKAKKLKLEFLSVIIKHGLDSRDTGILWIMREIKKLGGDVRGELLPEWIDQHTRDFIMTKFVKFQRASDISEWNSFCLSFFKLLVGDQSHSEQILEEIKLRLTKNKPNPMVNMIAETDSVALIKADDRSVLSQSRRGPTTREVIEASLIGENPFLTETSVLGLVEIKDAAAGELRQPMEALDQLAASQSVQRLPIQEYLAQRVTLPVTFDPNLRPDSPSREANTNDKLNESLSKLQSSALIGLKSQRSHRVMSPTQRSKRSQMLSARSAEKRKEFLKKGVVYIGDQQYKFPYGNLFGSELLGSGDASELASQMVTQAISQDRRRREVLLTQVSMNQESTSMLSSQMDPQGSPKSSSELQRLKSAVSVSSTTALADHRLGSALAVGPYQPNPQRGFSDFETSEDEEIDPFYTHVKFFDRDRLINKYPSKQQVIKHIAHEEDEMLELQEEMKRLESQEAERIIRIYRREQAESSKSRYNQTSKGTTGPAGTSSSHIPGLGDVEAVLIPHFQNRSVPEYKVDVLLYLSTFMGMKSARQEIWRQEKAEQKRQLIESLRAGKEDKLLRSLLGHKA